MSKKIIIVGPAYPFRGGPARFNENLCRAFVNAGYDAEIVSFTLQYPSILFPGTSQYEENLSKPNVNIVNLINTINPFSWIKTAQYINKQNPDIIIFRYWLPFFAPAFGSIARLLKKSIKVLALTDNILPHEKRIGDTVLTKYFVNACNGFITMSQKVLDDLNKFSSHQSKLLTYHPLYENYPDKIDKQQARQHLNLLPNENILLFFGLIRPYKGLDLLLEALNNPLIKNKNLKLLIAGEFYEDKEKYLEFINTHRLNDKVILIDKFIPDDEVNIYFSACDVVVQPYRSATNSGVSMVSYFYDKPIISTNVGGLKEIVLNNQIGWLCNADSTSIAEAIQKFLLTNDLCVFEQNIQEFKKQFSWEIFVHKVVELANQIKK